ncbi:MAG: efflux RND transporter permease subunit [Verrucomicrobiota bacterium]|nr:efflux RND transporter permease subunit [Verrucomicrobiota bacterium]
MLNRIISFSLHNRLFVVAFASLLMVYGVIILLRLPVDVFPDLNRPTVTIFSEAGDLAPEEVESLVTLPLETAMNGAKGVSRVRSASSIGLSIVWVEFEWGTDIYIDRQIVTEKLQQVSLPENVRPFLAPISSIMGEIMLVGLASDDQSVSPMDLRTLADWTIRRRLLSIPGISQVSVIGGELKQYQVLVNPAQLASYHLSLHDLEETLQNDNVNSTGGFFKDGYREVLVRNMARIQSLDDLRQTTVRTENNQAVPLSAFAEVRIGGPLTKRGDGSINGNPAIILSVQKQPSADTVALTKRVDRELADIQRALPSGITLHADLFRQSTFIQRAIRNVEDALRDGSILVIIILFLFLLNFRTTFITLTAIPLSIIITVIVFHLFGMTINTMTLGGLAVAIGELVDDAIVDVENVFRRLRENQLLDQPLPTIDVVYSASSEVRNSIVFASIIVVLVFLPLFALGGVEGRIFAPLGIAYITSILASLVVSLTVTPALCQYLLPKLKRLKEEKDGWVVRQIKQKVATLLAWGFPRTKPVLLAVLIAFILAMICVPFLGKEFLPTFNEGSLTVTVLTSPGTSLEESNRIGSIAERVLKEVPEIKKTARRTGRAEQDEHAEGVHSSEIELELSESDRDRETILQDVRDKLATIPGISVNIGQPISHRIDHMLSGVRAQIAVKIFGADLAVLRAKGIEIQSVMGTVPGIVDLQVERQVLIPQVHVLVDRKKAAQFNVSAGEVAQYAELSMQGRTVTQVVDGQMQFDVVLRLQESFRASREVLAQIPIDTRDNKVVPLGMVARIEEAKGPNVINRENVQRRMVVSANVADRDLVATVKEVQERVAQKVTLPAGYFLEYGGQFESQASASRLIVLLSLFSFAGMFLVLYSHFGSAMFATQIMLNIPLAFMGAIIGVLLTGGVFSIASMVGFIALTGIAARNGIMMISHYIHLIEHEGQKFGVEMIVRGTQERLVPVLMTALTASLALLPLILSGKEPGREILHPVAVVIFSGLFTSTLLDFIVTPLVFLRFGRASIARAFPKAVE